MALFFVISGFVITGMLCERLIQINNQRVRHIISSFYVQRAKRLIPLSYFVAITVTTIQLFIVQEEQFHYLTSLIFILFYVPNLYSGEWFYGFSDLPNPLDHYWSLGVEEQFYLVWPLVLLLILRRSIESQLKIVTLILTFFVLAHWIPPIFGIGGQSLPTTYFDLMLVGSALALLRRHFYFQIRVSTELAKLCLISLFIVALYFPTKEVFFQGTHPHPLYYVFQLFLVSGIFISSLRVGIKHRALQFIGNISYGIYLIHDPLLYYSQKYLLDNSVISALCIVTSIFLAWLSNKYFESRIYKRSGQ